MTYVVLWIAFSIAIGMLASKRGRGSGNWFLISLLISPLIALVFLLVVDDLSTKSGSMRTHTKCPACAELILREASKCKHCGSAVTPTRYDPAADVRVTAGLEVLMACALLVVFFIWLLWYASSK